MYTSFINHNSVIHKINPLIKIIIFLIILINTLCVTSVVGALLLILYLIILMRISQMTFIDFIKEIRKSYLLVLIIIFLVLLVDNNFYYTIKIILLIMNVILLITTTKEKEINYGFKKLFSFLDNLIPLNKIIDFFNNLSLIINIFDNKYQEQKKQNLLNNKNVSVKEIIINCKLEYQEIKKNKEIKMYNKDINKTVYNVNKIKLIDILLLISSIIVFVITVF